MDIRKLSEDEIPERLREIPQPPKQLFVRGALPDKNLRYLSVVGSRKYSSYGRDVCEKIVSELSGYPIVIISGLALGIDSLAHRAALSANLKTIAFPGSGVHDSVIYPRQHKKLAHEIIVAGGALISEHDPTFEAQIWSFPERNRLMVGISHAVLMIEAHEKSGTLITARLTSDYNRDLLTVPGSIFSQSSYGPHLFMRLGATPIRDARDVLEALGIEEMNKKREPQNLSDEERLVVSLLSIPKEKDILIRESKLPIQRIHTLLSAMELKGIIIERRGKIRLQ